MTKNIFYFIVLIQCIFILILIFYLYTQFSKNNNIFITPIENTTIKFPFSAKLSHFYEPKPNTSYKNKPQFFTLPYTPIYTINADSLNERYNYIERKEPSTYRVITMGDSFTYGQYVSTPNNWTEQLENILNRQCSKYKNYEVINLGVYGYDISYAIERYKKRGHKYNTDLIIWMLKSDDFFALNDITYNLSMKYKQEYITNGQLEKSIKKGQYYPHAIKAQNEFMKQYGENKIISIQNSLLDTFSIEYKNYLLYVSLRDIHKNQKEILEKIVKNRKHSYYYNNLPLFDRLPDLHPSNLGHQTIANNIYKYISKAHIIPCK